MYVQLDVKNVSAFFCIAFYFPGLGYKDFPDLWEVPVLVKISLEIFF